MAKTSQCSIGVTITGDGLGNTYVPPGSPIENTAAPQGGPVKVSLSAGNNTISVPTGAVGCVVSPPVTSTNGKTLKGVGGDTGFALHTSLPFVLSFGGALGASFVINSVGTEDLDVQWL